MANKRYLVVHPKFNIVGKKGIEAIAKGEEISLDAAQAKNLIATGKVTLVVPKKNKKKAADTDSEEEKAEAEAAAKAVAEAEGDK